MGRPPKDPVFLLSVRLAVAVSTSELEQVASCAELAGLTLSAYLRRAALAHPLPRPVSARNREARSELWRLASNLSQLGHVVNETDKRAVSPEALWELAGLARTVLYALTGETPPS
jgi:hypothetical protein